jgi:L-alanine-DL-glutamate epimerase-like enolase superfamily enzyme
MQIFFEPLTLHKRYPLTISRGTITSSEGLCVSVEHEGVTGIGEFASVAFATPAENVGTAQADFERLASLLAAVAPWEMQRVEEVAAEANVGHAALCALDAALHDWMGKRLGIPVYRLLGLDPARIPLSSVTLGIVSPEVARERVPEILARTGAKRLKVKLGSPEGIEADQALFTTVRECTPAGVSLRVDANGGWRDMTEARGMLHYLAERGAEYVEQPLAVGREGELPGLFMDRPLPLYVDESVRTAEDVPHLAGCVDGVNLKLLKAGGIRAALRLIHTARAHGLSVMIGCFSESSLGIAAGAALAPLVDHVDLDSHLNLTNAPFTGLRWEAGRTLPSDGPGLGVGRTPSEATS